MTYDNWDEILKLCEEVYLHSRYAEHAQSMIALIPQIRADSNFEDIVAFTSHATLCLQFPGDKTEICIWSDRIGMYEVYLYHPDDGDSHRVVVNATQIMLTLKNYLGKIKAPVT
jgi:hypothetical protein